MHTTNNSGVIYQIQKNADNSLTRKGIYVPNSREYSIFAPDRKVREYGLYEPQPIYVPTLITWTELVALILNKYPTTTGGVGTFTQTFVGAGYNQGSYKNLSSTSAIGYSATFDVQINGAGNVVSI
jgi:hypothetical protein